MTGGATAASAAVAGRWRSTTRTRVLRQRLDDPTFWVIQGSIVAIALFHVVLESTHAADGHEGPQLAHIPVVLFLLPVVVAGFRYGFEGGVRTGLEIALLSLPNVVVWHRGDWAWVVELGLVVIVVVSGAVIALPVERERMQRARAQAAQREAAATSARLAVLHEVASTLVRTADLEHALHLVLERLQPVLSAQSAAIVTSHGRDVSVEACTSDRDAAAVGGWLGTLDRRPRGRVIGAGSGRWIAPFVAGEDGPRGAVVVVRGARDPDLDPSERSLLAAVATQVGVALDNVRLQRLQREQLATFVLETTRVQEEERRHIARDLHDVATHELLLICRGLDDLADRRDGRQDTSTQLVQLRTRTAGVVDQLRRFSRDLRPAMLDTLGLGPALEWLTSELRQRAGIETSFEAAGVPQRLGDEVELALFRIVQEALRNVDRHARATCVSVCLRSDGPTTTVAVHDDGVGFEVPDPIGRAVREGCLGILGMWERAELIGAGFDLRSAPGHGTTVTVRWPGTERRAA